METNEDLEIQAKLKALQEDFERNEERMRKTALTYENLIAEKESLLGAIGELKKERAERLQKKAKT